MNALGYRVAPAEVEKCLMSLGGVADAAVAERPGRDAESTIIKAYVVLREGASCDEAAILSHCQAHLAAYKRPRAVVFLAALPRNANGKLNRLLLP
jgi:acyl-coenzyme A synthetase/AMP-(fatty) acid ligase